MGWAAEYWTMRRMSMILFVSDFDRQLAIRQKLLPSSKPFRVIHNGIPPLDPRTTEERLGIGFIGRFVYQKNPELFLDIAERLPKHQFVMAGGGNLDEKVRNEIENRGLRERVRLFGSLDYKSALEFISKLDVLVMPPRWEGLPLLPLEAMFMKVPVVSTSVGGIPEVIEHGATGMLSQSEKADELANHISKLLDNPELCSSIVDQAFQVAHKRFSQDSMLREIKNMRLLEVSLLPTPASPPE